VKGLRARGGFTVEMTWTNGALANAVIHGAAGSSCAVRYGNELRVVTIPKDGTEKFIPAKQAASVTLPAPAQVTASAQDGTARLHWDSVAGATSYVVQRAVNEAGPFVYCSAVEDGTNATVFGLTYGVKQYLTVSAANGGVTGAASAPVAVVPFGPPSGLAAVSGNARVTLNWNAFDGASAFNVKRATTKGGPYTEIATVNVPHAADTNVTNGITYYYVVSVVTDRESADSAEVSVLPEVVVKKLTGSITGILGSWDDSGNTIEKVFDGDLNTYFDAPNNSGGHECWVGLDLGEGNERVISQIKYCPRMTIPNRMIGGVFQGANAPDFSDAVTLFTVTAVPPTGVLTSVKVTCPKAFRYVRYLGAENSWGNVAEIEFYGYPSNASR